MVASGESKVTWLKNRSRFVDDEESIRKALQRLLKAAGYQVLTFASAEDFFDSKGEKT